MASEFAETLKALRQSARLSLAALARRTNYSRAAIGHAETGARSPTPELAMAIDRILRANGLLIALAAGEDSRRQNVSDVKRRQMLKAVTLSGAAVAADVQSSFPSRTGQTEIGQLLDRTAGLRRLDDSLGGADTFGLYMSEVRNTEKLCNIRPTPQEQAEPYSPFSLNRPSSQAGQRSTLDG